MTTVAELIPGDLVTSPSPAGEMGAIFVAQTQHPIWPHLQLVIWRMANRSWSHDALDARQDVGQAKVCADTDREARLRAALLGGAA